MTRRTARILGAATLLAAALALTACSTAAPDSAAGGDSTATGGSFTYEDARGTTVKTDTVPKTVVAQSSVAAALWDAGYKVKGAYGELTPRADGKLSYQAGSLNTKQLTVIGSTYGEFDVQKYALMKPDLLVDYTFDAKTLWYVPAKQTDQILGLAPSIGVPGDYASTDAAIDTFVDLAGRLGANTTSSTLTAQKRAYTAAQDATEKIASTTPLKVLVISPTKDTVYITEPTRVPELNTLEKAGLDVMSPKNAAKDVFTQVSWEQMADYADADVILVDARSYDATIAAIEDVSAWKDLPAVKAGQVHPWYTATPYSYKAYTGVYNAYTKDLQEATDLK